MDPRKLSSSMQIPSFCGNDLISDWAPSVCREMPWIQPQTADQRGGHLTRYLHTGERDKHPDLLPMNIQSASRTRAGSQKEASLHRVLTKCTVKQVPAPAQGGPSQLSDKTCFQEETHCVAPGNAHSTAVTPLGWAPLHPSPSPLLPAGCLG